MYLNKMRNEGISIIRCEYCLTDLREVITKGNLTLADIGTSEDELRELWVKCCKFSAQRWLDHLRNETVNYEYCLDCLRKEIAKGVITLEDIGTSEEELGELWVKCCKFSAQCCLEDLRYGTVEYEACLNHLREAVAKGVITLEDIGTSEEEIASFVP